jgi:8-oxo-dGTP pyrophosphatase MutT (NUDIX family)
MPEFEIITHGLYHPDQLAIDYDSARRMPVTTEIQAWMDGLWQQKLTQAHEQGRRLFDAPLFRFIAANAQKDGYLHLTLGDTSYKEYVTTRTPDFAQKHARENLGNPLAVCSVVETSDNYILLDKRQGVDVYVGRYHVIGGFFERELDMGTQPDPFAALRREIREETGIQASDIKEQYCLGVVYDLLTPHGETCFLTRLNIPLHDVLHNRTPEEDEIKQIHALQATPENLHEFIVTKHGNISATGEPNLLLYGGEKFGRGWFDEASREPVPYRCRQHQNLL